MEMRAALAALAHGLKVAAEGRDRAHAAHLGGPRPDRRREAPHLPLWHALCVRYFKRPVGGGNGDASYTHGARPPARRGGPTRDTPAQPV